MAYNPGIQYRGDQYLYQGITGAADALAQGIKRIHDERKAAKETDAAFDAMGSVMNGMAKVGVNIPPEVLQQYAQVQKADTNTKQGALRMFGQGLNMFMQAQQQQLAQQQAETAKGYLKIQQDQAARLAAAADKQGTFGEILQRYLGNGYDVPMDLPDATMRAAAESRMATPENMADLERAQNSGRSQAVRSVRAEPRLVVQDNPVTGKKEAVWFQEDTGVFSPSKDPSSRPATQADILHMINGLMIANSSAGSDDKTRAANDAQIKELRAMLPHAVGAPTQGETEQPKFVVMSDPQGNKVRVPADRVEEARKKGYR